MDVVGYQTNIPEPHYVFTPFVEFVAKAWLHPDVPFFLCLDETTCTFSRKVLDRAMSFEMNEVDYDSFIAGQSDVISTALSSDVSKLLIDREIDAKEVVDEIDSKQVLDYLKAVNVALEGTPFKLGYRAANEALLYVSAAHRFGQNSLSAALDEFTLMKILSRIEGDTTKLKIDDLGDKTVLSELRELISKYLKPDNSTTQDYGTQTEESAETNAQPAQDTELKSIKKIDHMIKQLTRNGFVSYWE